MSDKEIVICSAVKAEDGTIIRGHRHRDCIAAIFSRGKKPARERFAQGFITSTNRFVTREEGYQIQRAAGIDSVASGGYRGQILFSEDLY